jgi:hypothetical protein
VGTPEVEGFNHFGVTVSTMDRALVSGGMLGLQLLGRELSV